MFSVTVSILGMFPTYRDSPLQTTLPRVLAVGDASGIQSPLSFGGFGSLTRHIERITGRLFIQFMLCNAAQSNECRSKLFAVPVMKLHLFRSFRKSSFTY